MVQELTQVWSPIKEEDKEDNTHQERDPLVDDLFPYGSEEGYYGSQQSIEQKVGIRTCFYAIIIFQKHCGCIQCFL